MPDPTTSSPGLGDKFAVLLQVGDLNAGIGVRRIIAALRVPVMIGNQRVFPSCNIGITQSGDRLDARVCKVAGSQVS